MLKIALFAYSDIGLEVVKYFSFKQVRIKALIIDSQETESIKTQIVACDIYENIFYSDSLQTNETLMTLKEMDLDLAILAWWPHIIKKPLLDIAKIGFLNFHPSLLPYNRGKHYYFWNIIEQVPFGVTLHLIDEEIDKGRIVFQKALKTTWLDTGYSLRERSKSAIVELFKENFDGIVKGAFADIEVNWNIGTQHFGKELKSASKLDLDSTIKTRYLLNLLRARSGFESGGIWFDDEGKRYEINITIKEDMQ